MSEPKVLAIIRERNEKRQQLEEKKASGTKTQDYVKFDWKKGIFKPKAGTNYIRVLPNPFSEEEGKFFITVEEHNSYTFNSVVKEALNVTYYPSFLVLPEGDPIVELKTSLLSERWAAKKAGNEAREKEFKETAAKFYSSTKHILFVKDSEDPDVIKYWVVNDGVLEKLISLINVHDPKFNPKKQIAVGDFFSLTEGNDLVLTGVDTPMKNGKKGKDGNVMTYVDITGITACMPGEAYDEPSPYNDLVENLQDPRKVLYRNINRDQMLKMIELLSDKLGGFGGDETDEDTLTTDVVYTQPVETPKAKPKPVETKPVPKAKALAEAFGDDSDDLPF